MPGSAPLGPDGDPAPVAGEAPDHRVPLVVPDAALPLTRDGRRVRAAEVPTVVSPLRALAGAGLAVAGVVLGIGALLSVTDSPGGSPALSVEDSRAAAGQGEPDPEPDPLDDAPAVAAPAPTTAPTTAPTAAPPLPAPVRPAPAAPAPARAAAQAPQRAALPAAPRRTAAPRPPVTVLNNSTRTGLADRAAARFVRNGWPVRQVGNFRGQLRATTVYYEPGQRAAAQRFAATFRGIDRVLPRAANIPGPRGIVVVLTRSFDA